MRLMAQRPVARLSSEPIQGRSVHSKGAGNVHDRVTGVEPLDRFTGAGKASVGGRTEHRAPAPAPGLRRYGL
jgi:hypothetical protein